jgi:hypothetical protein
MVICSPGNLRDSLAAEQNNHSAPEAQLGKSEQNAEHIGGYARGLPKPCLLLSVMLPVFSVPAGSSPC